MGDGSHGVKHRGGERVLGPAGGQGPLGEGGAGVLREERSGVGEEEATRGEGHVSGAREKQSEATWIRGEREI